MTVTTMTATTMTVRRLVLLATLLMITHGLPYILLQNTRPKCLSVMASRQTTLFIIYHAPDMMIIPEDDSIPPNVPWKPSINVTDGADALFQQQYLANLQVMKRANMKDLSVVIQQTQHQEQQQQRNGRTDWHERQRDRQRQEGSGIMKKELNARIDMIEYDTGSIDGPVEFCWQSMSANTKVPQRLMLNITQHSTIGLQEKEQRAHQKKELVQEHLPRIEADLHGMDRKIQMILSNADFAKDQEIEFHTMSTRMNKATKYWPMIHVTVLFLTGLTQANHIVKFFKERHIF